MQVSAMELFFPRSFLGFGRVRGRYIRRFKENINSTPKAPCFSCFYQYDLLVAKPGKESFLILLASRIRGFHLKPKIKQILCV